MTFSKSFPKKIEGSNFPQWEEIYLTEEEEKEVDDKVRRENIRIMRECLDDAKLIATSKGVNESSAEVIQIAKSLFEKLASHEIYWKEEKAKDKFDKSSKLLQQKP